VLTGTQRPAVVVRDVTGKPVPGVSVSFTSTATARGLGASFFSTSQPGNVELTDADGIATVATVRVDTALTGSPRVTARVDTVTGVFSGPVSGTFRTVLTNRAGGASKTAFLNQPPSQIAPAVSLGTLQVEIQDQFGNRNTAATPTITLAFGQSPPGATLSGTVTAVASNGIAT